jgi:hypothetical protein
MALAGELKVGSERYLLSHFPYDGEGRAEVTERHTQWRLRDLGSTLRFAHATVTTAAATDEIADLL